MRFAHIHTFSVKSRDKNFWLIPSRKIPGSRDFAKSRPGNPGIESSWPDPAGAWLQYTFQRWEAAKNRWHCSGDQLFTPSIYYIWTSWCILLSTLVYVLKNGENEVVDPTLKDDMLLLWLYIFWNPAILDWRTWRKFGEHGESFENIENMEKMKNINHVS